MQHPLTGSYEKVRRAQRHLEELQAEVKAFFDAHPCTATVEPDPAVPGEDRVIAHLPTESFPIQLSCILGDYVHNLRSALDHLAWQLVGAIAPEAQSSKTAFPIFTSREQWEQSIVKPRQVDKRPSMLRGIDDQTFDVIERMQPFQPNEAGDPTRAALAVLADLSNTDKHRILLTAATVVPHHTPTVTGEGFDYAVVDLHVGPVEDGGEIGRIQLFSRDPEPPLSGGEPYVDVRSSVEIGFGERRVPGTQLRVIAENVVKVLDVFVSCWETEPPTDE